MQRTRWMVWSAAAVITTAVLPAAAAAGPSGGALPPQLVLEVQVVEVGGIPSDAEAVALNVTVTGTSGPGYLTVFPCDQEQPDTSNVNYVTGVDVPNAVISKVGSEGTVCVATSAVTDVIVDISGYFPAGSPLQPIPNPERILDTRGGIGAPRIKLTAGETLAFNVGGVRSTPSNASAAVMNMTAVDAQTGGYATVYPCGQSVPDASNLNFVTGQTVPNLVISRLGDGGKVCITSTAAIEVLADVAAYFPAEATGYTPIANPQRVLDTRNGVGAPKAASRPNVELGFQARALAGVPATATAVVLNMTATGSAVGGYTTVYPCGAPLPATSSLNFSARADVPNLVIAAVGVLDGVCTQSSSSVHLLADVAGYFEGNTAYVPLTNPYRAADTRQDGQLRCNLAISVMINNSVTVTDLRTGMSRTVSHPRMKEYLGNSSALLADCSGFVSLVDAGAAGGSDVFEFKFDGSAAFLYHSIFPGNGTHMVEVLDDGRIVDLSPNGVVNARTGEVLVSFKDSLGFPIIQPGVLVFTPAAMTGDGVAIFNYFASGSNDAGLSFWDSTDGSLIATASSSPNGHRTRSVSRYGTYFSEFVQTPSGVRVLVKTADGQLVQSSPFVINLPPGDTYPRWIGDGSMLVCQNERNITAVYRWDLFSPPTLLFRGICPTTGA